MRPGAEIVNTLGDLDLDTTWDFTQTVAYSPGLAPGESCVLLDRFGPSDLEAGILLLRARGDISLGQGMDPNTGRRHFRIFK